MHTNKLSLSTNEQCTQRNHGLFDVKTCSVLIGHLLLTMLLIGGRLHKSLCN